MATVGRRVLLVNGKRRRNRARRKMSPKQIRIFGTRAQKAALKRSRKPKKARRNAPRKTSHRPRTRPRTAPRKKTRRRKNVSEIITASLAGLAGNPGGRRRKAKAKPQRKRKAMAKPRKRKKSAGRRVNRKHYTARKNTGRRTRRSSHKHRTKRSNPSRSMGGITNVLIDAGWAGAGAVASRAIPNMVLGAGNSGLMGYGANVITGLALAWGVKGFLKNSRAAADIMLGTVIGLLFRAVQDFTPYGKYASLNGMGDFQMTEFFTPRILNASGGVDPSQSLQVAARANAAAAEASASGRSLGAFYRRSFINR